MTLVNMNPPMSHQHHPPTRPGEDPHNPYNNPPGVRNHDHLANQMSQLHLHQDRYNEARPRNSIVPIRADEDADKFYVGYTFFKAPPTPGHNPSWSKADKTRMNLSQSDLLTLVQKKAKRVPVMDQYQNLKMIRRAHVDGLIEDLRQSDPQYHWSCVYVKEEERDVKGKSYPRGSYETSSMDIILMGEPINPRAPRARRVNTGDTVHGPVHTQQHIPKEPHPFFGGDHAEQWRGPAFQQVPTPPHLHNAQQAPAQFHQHVPHSQPPPHNTAGEPQYPQQGHWPQNIPMGHPPRPTPAVHNPVNPGPADHPTTRAQDTGPKGAAKSPDIRHHEHENPNQKASRNHQAKSEKKHNKSMGHVHGSEPDLVYDSTSSGEDDSLTPGYDDEDSEDEFSERNTRAPKTPLPWRGSLHRGYSSSQPHHSCRTHTRRDPQWRGDHIVGRQREDAAIDLTPASSGFAPMRLGKTHGGGRRMARPYESQPRVIHQQVSSDDLELELMSQIRGRARNDIRSRMLNDWEADLEEREKLFEYRKQMFKETMYNDRMEEGGFPGRSRSLRQPLTAYPHNYLPRALH
ncbi:uncharacterized protein BJX67DRAFT_188630 [Aspergillus lucknowensis]|uniref:Uncharacterized protein n=1 Tax=Aspergillus lucknowensis TaxID=176173 RepID=A0ABR4LLW4_9EURO